MKARTIRLERLFDLGHYENERISIEMEIEEGDRASDVLAKARIFMEKNRPGRSSPDDAPSDPQDVFEHLTD